MIALTIVAGLVAALWTTLFLLTLSRLDSQKLLGPGQAASHDAPVIDAVVPARNEEAHVAATIAFLRRQEYPKLRITVVDDQSTDRTGAILDELAADGSIRVVHGVERPAGWVGKTWAVHQGVATTTAEWLWFVDADMGLHSRALATAVAEAEARGADLVSLLPRGKVESFWQGAFANLFSHLLSQLYPLDRVNDPNRPEAIAAGGFILVKRSAYHSAGGHEACRGEIVDDIKLAQKVKAAGGRLAVFPAPDLAWTHMYGDFAAIWKGLRKNAYAGMDYQPHKFVTGAVVGMIAAWAPWVALVVGAATSSWLTAGVGALGVLAQFLASWPMLVFLRASKWYGLTLPAAVTAYVLIATSSVWHHYHGRILWKGRVIDAKVTRVPLPPLAAGSSRSSSQAGP